MLETKKNIQNRIDYYDGLIKEGLNKQEEKQLENRGDLLSLTQDHNTHALLSSERSLFPQIGISVVAKFPPESPTVSTSFGGQQLGGAEQAKAVYFGGKARTKDIAAISQGIEGSNERRKAEWKQQLKLAKQEKKQLEKQEKAAEIRKTIAQKDLEIHQERMKQTDELDEFYLNKFTNLGLYDYLCSNLNLLFREAYNVAYDLAKVAEQAYQFEIDDDEGETIFIATDNWQFDRAGLLSGQKLLLQLQQMEKSYLEKNTRRYEITQSFSLNMLDPSQLVSLRQEGSCQFLIPEIAFDVSYPGQYKRFIKSVSITIPCVVGPTQNISAKLTLISSDIRTEPKIDDSVLVPTDVGKLTSIYVSGGQNDRGMFEFSFRDERYNPFEGAGAISTWKLDLPSAIRPFDYDTISDVMISISYTAKDDEVFRTEVEDEMKSSLSEYASNGLHRLLSLKHEFPTALHQLLNPTADIQSTEIELEMKHFPYFVSGNQLDIDTVTVFLQARDSSRLEATKYDLQIRGEKPVLWEDFGENMNSSIYQIKGPALGTWEITENNNKLVDNELEDILILLKYKTS